MRICDNIFPVMLCCGWQSAGVASSSIVVMMTTSIPFSPPPPSPNVPATTAIVPNEATPRTPLGISSSLSQNHQVSDLLLLTMLNGDHGQDDASSSSSTPSLSPSEDQSFSSSMILSSSSKTAKLPLVSSDKVIRIVDANTVQLESLGQVSLAGIKTPSPTSSNFKYPDCFPYSPTYKLRQLIPAKTKVKVEQQELQDGSNKKQKYVVLIRQSDGMVVNSELVKSGFARVKKETLSSSNSNTLQPDDLLPLQQAAKEQQLGIYMSCTTSYDQQSVPNSIAVAPVAEFEPLDDRDNSDHPKVTPPNPVEQRRNSRKPVRGCSDFKTYEEALRWYEFYGEYYGDVANLDRDRDGIPCPGLPHTTNPNLYRMKVPTKVDRQKE